MAQDIEKGYEYACATAMLGQAQMSGGARAHRRPARGVLNAWDQPDGEWRWLDARGA